MTDKQNTALLHLKSLTDKDFLNFGIQDVAYIRPVHIDDQEAFVIHAADGTPLSVMQSMKQAIILARHNELEPVTVH